MNTKQVHDSSVSVLLISLFEREILVPKSMVIDILTWDSELFLPGRNAPKAWKIGSYLWHDRQIPLVCIETLINKEVVNNEMYKPKVAIIKSVQHDSDNKLYAVRCDGFPRPLILGEQALNNLAVEQEEDWINYSISIGSRTLDILDFNELESAIWADVAQLSDTA